MTCFMVMIHRQVSHDDQIVKIRSAYKNLCQANEFVVVEGTVRATPGTCPYLNTVISHLSSPTILIMISALLCGIDRAT